MKFKKYEENAKRLYSEATDQFDDELRKTHDNLKEFRSRGRTYLNSKERRTHFNDDIVLT